MHFKLHNSDPKSQARAGEITTERGVIQTPVFMPVGTVGSVKAVHFEELKTEIDADIILGNTYHLYLRPGTDIIKKAGGLHKFNSWDRPILTDSGGYQVFSLSHRRKINENGATFKSHIDGSKHLFTPENVMDIQRIIGGDFIMAFDECVPYPCEFNYAKRSMEMTHRWLSRCIDRFDSTDPIYGVEQTLIPIVQGSMYADLRKKSAEYVASCDRPINAIGGLSVGEPHDLMYEMTDVVCSILPKDKPRYLMGVGTPANLLECIALGIDMFDCVLPTRNGRNGQLFTAEGVINIKNAKWKEDFSPIDSNSPASTSQIHTKAYLRHLFISGELLAYQIASIHNLAFYKQLMQEARSRIIAGDFTEWKNQIVTKLAQKL